MSWRDCLRTPGEQFWVSSPRQLGGSPNSATPGSAVPGVVKLRNPWKNIWGVTAKLRTARKCRSRLGVNHKRLEINLVTPTIFSNHNFSNASGPFSNAHLFRSDIFIKAESWCKMSKCVSYLLESALASWQRKPRSQQWRKQGIQEFENSIFYRSFYPLHILRGLQ